MARALCICHAVSHPLLFNAGHIGLHVHLDTALLHALHNHIPGLFVKAAQDRLAAIPKMGLHPKTIENAGKFTLAVTTRPSAKRTECGPSTVARMSKVSTPEFCNRRR